MANTRTIDQEALGILSACAVNGQTVILPPALDRPLYEKVNKVLEALGGKWNRSARGHVFQDNPQERLEAAILTETYEKNTHHGFFETPPDLADRLVELAEIEPGMQVLEPSAGRGSIAEAISRRMASERLTLAQMTLVEIRQDNVDALLLKGYADVLYINFLDLPPVAAFDRIIMNPPFERLQDVAHVQHALKFLKPGGRLVSIMSPGWRFRQEKAAVEFRNLIEVLDEDASWTPLPEGSFKASGTMASTGILVIDQ